jgi:hypothetical protein
MKSLNNLVGILLIRDALSSSSSAATDRSKHGIRPDPFVEAAPLVLAACCRDGAVILAAHTVGVDEPLVYWKPETVTASITATTSATTTTEDQPQQQVTNLPNPGYKGPLRINSIDRFGTALVCSGWRADCQVLVEKCRSLATAEVMKFGEPSRMEYGNMLASDLSLHLAQCAVSERVSYCTIHMIVILGTGTWYSQFLSHTPFFCSFER